MPKIKQLIAIAWAITVTEPDTSKDTVFHVDYANKSVEEASALINQHDKIVAEDDEQGLHDFFEKRLTKDIKKWDIETDDDSVLEINKESVQAVLATGYMSSNFKRAYLDFLVKIRDGKSLTEKEEETKNLLASVNGGPAPRRKRW